MKKLSLLSLCLLIPFIVSAQEEAIDLNIEIENMEGLKVELQTQVQEETITSEEAKATWQEKLDELREQKDALFQKKMDALQTKYLQKKNEIEGEKELISNKLKEIVIDTQKRVSELKMISKEIKMKLRTGEITKEEAKTQLREMRQEEKKIKEEKREERKEMLKSEKEDRSESKEMKQEQKQKMEDTEDVEAEIEEGETPEIMVEDMMNEAPQKQGKEDSGKKGRR